MYAKFGGLGIHNCLLYAEVVKLRAKNKNITELLAYRSIATYEQAVELMVNLTSLICYIRQDYFHVFDTVFGS